MTAAWWLLDPVVIAASVIDCAPVWNVILGFNDDGVIWFSLIVIAPMTRAGLETLAVRLAFSRRIGRKGYWVLFLGNAICLAVAMYVLILLASAHPAIA